MNVSHRYLANFVECVYDFWKRFTVTFLFSHFIFNRFQSHFMSYVFGMLSLEIFLLDTNIFFGWFCIHTNFWIGTSSTDNGKERQLLFQPVDESVVSFSLPFSFRIQPITKTGTGERNEKSIWNKGEKKEMKMELYECKTCAMYVEIFLPLLFLFFFFLLWNSDENEINPSNNKTWRTTKRTKNNERQHHTLRMWLKLCGCCKEKRKNSIYISHFIPHMHNANYKANGFKLWMKQKQKK